MDSVASCHNNNTRAQQSDISQYQDGLIKYHKNVTYINHVNITTSNAIGINK